MIRTLLVTILVEGVVGTVYAVWRRKPFVSILVTGVLANLFTQSLLWIALNFFFQSYLAVLFIAEILIWLMESVLLYRFRPNALSLREALFLSFAMNLSSFALGWWLPI